MEIALFNSSSKADLKLLMELAKKLGIRSARLSKQEMEDLGLALAIKKDETGTYVDTDKFIRKLRSK